MMKLLPSLIGPVTLLVVFAAMLSAQEPAEVPNNPPPPLSVEVNEPPAVPTPIGVPQQKPNEPAFNAQVVPTRTTQEIWLSIGVLIFGLFTVGAMITYLGRKTDEPATELMKFPVLALIIVGALFLVTAGYGNDQIAPIIGLMGTLAGYLLGRPRETKR
ncbi:MAG: hypothetical protein WBA17_00010 [Saprospiraceae bacterium]